MKSEVDLPGACETGGHAMQLSEIRDPAMQEYAGLFAQVFSEAPWNEQWSTGQANERLEFYRNTPNFIGLCARTNGALAGFAMGNFEPPQQQGFFLLKEMCVSRRHQGLGVGSALLDALHSKLVELDIHSVNLITRIDSDAERFYRKHGYRKLERTGLYATRLWVSADSGLSQ